ncbi:unnamed protein product [Polarella glacialis]|uniref:Uncharacterized protein n=1 Tax=Polarella glacialis TaxID=89957 RepID=A0A813D634_POLGL|nr:unnamed protein product [Polarella glacialis]
MAAPWEGRLAKVEEGVELLSIDIQDAQARLQWSSRLEQRLGACEARLEAPASQLASCGVDGDMGANQVLLAAIQRIEDAQAESLRKLRAEFCTLDRLQRDEHKAAVAALEASVRDSVSTAARTWESCEANRAATAQLEVDVRTGADALNTLAGAKVQGRLAGFGGELLSLQRELGLLHGVVHDSELGLEAVGGQIRRLDELRSTSLASLKTLLRAESLSSKEEGAAALAQLEGAVQEASQKAARACSVSDASQASIQKLEIAVSEAASSAARAEEASSANETSLNSFQAQLGEAVGSVSSLAREAASLASRLGDVSSTNDGATSKLNGEVKDIRQLLLGFQVEERFAAVDGKLSLMQSDLGQLYSGDEEARRLTAEVARLDAQVQATAVLADGVGKSQADRDSLLAKLESAVHDAFASASEAMQVADASAQDVREVRDVINQIPSFSKMEDRFADVHRQLSAGQVGCEQLRAVVDGLQGGLGSLAAEVTELRGGLGSDVTSSSPVTDDKVTANDGQLVAAVGCETALAKLEGAVHAVSASSDAHGSAISKLQAEVREVLEQRLSAVDSRLTAVQDTMDKLKGSTGADTLESDTVRLAKLPAKSDPLEVGLEATGGLALAWEERLRATESQMAALHRDLGLLQDESFNGDPQLLELKEAYSKVSLLATQAADLCAANQSSIAHTEVEVRAAIESMSAVVSEAVAFAAKAAEISAANEVAIGKLKAVEANESGSGSGDRVTSMESKLSEVQKQISESKLSEAQGTNNAASLQEKVWVELTHLKAAVYEAAALATEAAETAAASESVVSKLDTQLAAVRDDISALQNLSETEQAEMQRLGTDLRAAEDWAEGFVKKQEEGSSAEHAQICDSVSTAVDLATRASSTSEANEAAVSRLQELLELQGETFPAEGRKPAKGASAGPRVEVSEEKTNNNSNNSNNNNSTTNNNNNNNNNSEEHQPVVLAQQVAAMQGDIAALQSLAQTEQAAMQQLGGDLRAAVDWALAFGKKQEAASVAESSRIDTSVSAAVELATKANSVCEDINQAFFRLQTDLEERILIGTESGARQQVISKTHIDTQLLALRHDITELHGIAEQEQAEMQRLGADLGFAVNLAEGFVRQQKEGSSTEHVQICASVSAAVDLATKANTACETLESVLAGLHDELEVRRSSASESGDRVTSMESKLSEVQKQITELNHCDMQSANNAGRLQEKIRVELAHLKAAVNEVAALASEAAETAEASESVVSKLQLKIREAFACSESVSEQKLGAIDTQLAAVRDDISGLQSMAKTEQAEMQRLGTDLRAAVDWAEGFVKKQEEGSSADHAQISASVSAAVDLATRANSASEAVKSAFSVLQTESEERQSTANVSARTSNLETEVRQTLSSVKLDEHLDRKRFCHALPSEAFKLASHSKQPLARTTASCCQLVVCNALDALGAMF